MDTRNISSVCKTIRKGNGGIVFKLDSDFVYENFITLIKAISESKMTEDQIGGLIDYLRDVKNSYETELKSELC
ncbi:MAG: hypothetical protein ACLRFL_02450 [Clostridia bacterium]